MGSPWEWPKIADGQVPVVAKADEEFHKPVQETVALSRAVQACIDLYMTDWVTAQQEDLIPKMVIQVDL